MPHIPFQTFDRNADYGVTHRLLPHWSQSACLTFITFRTYDSLPASVVQAWQIDRRNWLRNHGVDPDAADWQQQIAAQDPRLPSEYRRQFSARWHEHLDQCHGECVLKDPVLSAIVGGSFQHFDGDRYELTDFVVMPNHVHLIAAFVTESTMLSQCESWKRFTAKAINQRMSRKGRFWEQDAFDHLIRSENQFWYLRKYIADNPVRAHLPESAYLHYSKPLDRTAESSHHAPRDEASARHSPSDAVSDETAARNEAPERSGDQTQQ